MGRTKIEIDERVYEKIEARMREDETVSEAIERLVGRPQLVELAGLLSDETADEFRDAIERIDGEP